MIASVPSDTAKQGPAAFVKRLCNSAVGWSWALNGLRLSMGILLLPLVLRKLPTADLGMYYVFLSLVAIVPLVDFGFGPAVGRFVSYAMGGAEVLQSQGVAKIEGAAAPNYHLLWELLFTTRTLYRILATILFFLLGAWGTYVVELRIHETASVTLTRLAWGVSLLSAVWEIYSNWWEIFLRGMNQVTAAARIAFTATAVRLLLAGVLLVLGWGLLSLPVASLVGSFIQRQMARRRCLHLLGKPPDPGGVGLTNYLRMLWPNAWRFGVQCVAGYLTTNVNTLICVQVLGLAANARYGLSLQLLNVAVGMSGVWIAVKWPAIGQYYARHDFSAIRLILRQRIWWQILTFLCMSAVVVFCLPPLLQRFGSGKQVLSWPWFPLLALYSFLEMNCGTWGTLIALGNRIPYLWYGVATYVLSLILSLALIRLTSLGLGALVLGPLIAGSVFNFWYWPIYAARTVGSTLPQVLIPSRTHCRNTADHLS